MREDVTLKVTRLDEHGSAFTVDVEVDIDRLVCAANEMLCMIALTRTEKVRRG